MSKLVLKNLTSFQNSEYTGLNGEVVNVLAVGFAIHDGVNAGGTVYDTQKQKGGRNLLRNGDFSVNQNGNMWEDLPQLGDYSYIADAWFFQRSGGSRANIATSENYIENVSEIQRSLRVTTFTGGGVNSFSLLSQRKEGALLFSGKTLTISFWAKANIARSIAVEMGNDFRSSTQNQNVLVGRVDLTTQWQYFSFTFKFPNRPAIFERGVDNHTWLYLWLEAGDWYNDRTGGINVFNGSFDFADIQLEEGEVASPYERLEYNENLNRVRYYFEKQTNVISLNKYGDTTAENKAGGFIQFAKPKRKEPIISAEYGFLSGPSTFGISTQGFNVVGTANSEESVSRLVAYTADAEIKPL